MSLIFAHLVLNPMFISRSSKERTSTEIDLSQVGWSISTEEIATEFFVLEDQKVILSRDLYVDENWNPFTRESLPNETQTLIEFEDPFLPFSRSG